MSRSLRLIFSVVLLLKTSQAYYDNQPYEVNAGQDSVNDAYLANPWTSPYYYQPRPVPDFIGPYEARTPNYGIQPYNYYFKSAEDSQNLPADSRFLGTLGASLLSPIFNNRFSSSNTFRPFAGISNLLPVTLNPNFVNPIYESCTSTNGESGICATGSACSLFGGRPSGSCTRGRVCCINAVTSCGGSVTLNNTYWQSPTTAVSSPSTCSLTVKLNSKYVEQKRPICQVRLDFVSFSIAQPNIDTVCNVDTFQVGGAVNKIPTICGDNNGQHMYLEVPPSSTNPSDLQLLFNFGTGSTNTRSWNIKVALLPCGASYLAPQDCLQYFTVASGKVSSFNWKDVAVAEDTTRQLANQEYNICFRTELVDSQKANSIRLSACPTPNGGNSFLLSDTEGSTTVITGTAADTCLTDYLIVPGGKNDAATPLEADRFCGNILNTDPDGTAYAPVFTSIKSFRLTYKTDGSEAAAETVNTGFCLTFDELTA